LAGFLFKNTSFATLPSLRVIPVKACRSLIRNLKKAEILNPDFAKTETGEANSELALNLFQG